MTFCRFRAAFFARKTEQFFEIAYFCLIFIYKTYLDTEISIL